MLFWDLQTHVTPVAGIISAEQGNETGVVGIAFDADIAATAFNGRCHT